MSLIFLRIPETQGKINTVGARHNKFRRASPKMFYFVKSASWGKAEVAGAQVHIRSPLLCRLVCIAI